MSGHANDVGWTQVSWKPFPICVTGEETPVEIKGGKCDCEGHGRCGEGNPKCLGTVNFIEVEVAASGGRVKHAEKQYVHKGSVKDSLGRISEASGRVGDWISRGGKGFDILWLTLMRL